jgi:PadR family transcriptional regulator PadR
MKTDDRFDLPQGTLDLFSMRAVALGPIHGYAIAQRIQQVAREALQVRQGSLYPALVSSTKTACRHLEAFGDRAGSQVL